MKLKILPFVFLLTINLISQNKVNLLPPDFPFINIITNNNPTSGQIFLSDFPNGGTSIAPYLILLNNDGSIFSYKKLSANGFGFTEQPNGNYTYFDASVGYFLELDRNFNIIDSFYTQGGFNTDLHELRLLPNGNALLLGSDPEIIDMSKIVPGGNPNAIVTGLIIQELDKNKNVIFQWRSWDHFKITDAMPDINLLDSTIDYVHGNAIEVDNDGNFLLSSRHLDEITKINSTTGDIIWRLGGKNNQFTFINDTIGFSHQHAIRRIANGDITLFDNGNLHTIQESRAVEYKLDEVNKIATLVWEFRHKPEIYTFAMGYVQRLSNGNTLIGWGANTSSDTVTSKVAVTEVTPDGNTVFESTLPLGIWSYRAYRFDVSADSINSISNVSSYDLSNNYPNPFNPTTKIRYTVINNVQVKLTVYDILGKEVVTLVNEVKQPNTYEVEFNGENLSSGIYFYQLRAGNYINTKKMILLK
jgi:hypothetical protein